MNTTEPTTSNCIEAACKAYNVDESHITQKTRALDVVNPRDLAILLIKKQLPMISNREIGELVGLTTSAVLYSLRRSRDRVRGDCSWSRSFTTKYEQARQEIK